MKIYRNEALKIIRPEEVKNLDDIAILIDSSSKNYKKLIQRHFDYQKRMEDGIWDGVYPCALEIAKNICHEKTVHRFHADLSCIIFKKNRFRGGKQTSNIYRMHKTAYQYLKAFWRLGLWKKGVDFESRWSWIKKMWIECGCNHLAFMNRVWSYKSPNPNKLGSGFEQGLRKMSHGEFQKCPTISNSLSEAMKMCTGWVPDSQVKAMMSLLLNKTRESLNDLKWYVQDQGNSVKSYPGFFSSSLRRHLTPRKC